MISSKPSVGLEFEIHFESKGWWPNMQGHSFVSEFHTPSAGSQYLAQSEAEHLGAYVFLGSGCTVTEKPVLQPLSGKAVLMLEDTSFAYAYINVRTSVG